MRIQLSIATVGITATFLPGVALAQTTSGPDHFGWGPQMMGWGWGGMIFGPIFMILLLALVIAAAVFLVRWLSGSPQTATAHHPFARTPLDILKERFARGEIDKDEFEERRRILGE